MNYSTTCQNQVTQTCTDKERTNISVCAEKSDQQLIELILAGEKVAFEEIFERYKKLVASIARYYFQRPD